MRSTIVVLCLLPALACAYPFMLDAPDTPDKIIRRDPASGLLLKYDISDSARIYTNGGVRNVLRVDGVDPYTDNVVYMNQGGLRTLGNRSPMFMNQGPARVPLGLNYPVGRGYSTYSLRPLTYRTLY